MNSLGASRARCMPCGLKRQCRQFAEQGVAMVHIQYGGKKQVFNALEVKKEKMASRRFLSESFTSSKHGAGRVEKNSTTYERRRRATSVWLSSPHTRRDRGVGRRQQSMMASTCQTRDGSPGSYGRSDWGKKHLTY